MLHPSRAMIYQEISRRRHIDGFHVELLPRAAYSASDPCDRASFGVALERQTGVHAIGSDLRVDFDAWPGTSALAPAGLPVFSESPVGGEYLVVRWQARGGLPQRRIERMGDRAALRWAMIARRALVGPASPGSDERLRGALQGLLAHALAWEPTLPTGLHEIDRGTWASLLEFIEDHLQDAPRHTALDALAEQTGLSSLGLLRNFKRITGFTPHAYVAERRVQRAREQLRRPGAVLADVAADCGFAHQSHMGAEFRRRLGISPGAYRGLARARNTP